MGGQEEVLVSVPPISAFWLVRVARWGGIHQSGVKGS